MKSIAARAAKEALFRCGWHSRRIRRGAFPGVLVLCYHGVREDGAPPGSMPFEGLHVRARSLEAHCKLLRETCDPISLDMWRKAEHGGAPLPSRPVLVTFDDGYRSVLSLALPVLRRHAIPAVVFACSEPIERRRRFWFDAVAAERGEAAVESMKSEMIGDWNAFVESTARGAAANDPCTPMTTDELRELAADPLIEIGAHTASHPILSRIPSEQQREQIARNKADLERWIGRPVRAFAFPNGRRGLDYDAEAVSLLREEGFDFAFTTSPGFAQSAEPSLERSRFMMLAGIGAAEFAHRLAHSWRR